MPQKHRGYASDWGSRGDLWVRTELGWRALGKMSSLEEYSGAVNPGPWTTSQTYNIDENGNNTSSRYNQQSKPSTERQPFVMYQRSNKNGSTSLSEMITRLDMDTAVRDVRRANYMSKFLTIIFEKKLTDLSGTAQKLIFKLLESMVSNALETDVNLASMEQLVACAHTALQEGRRQHIGGTTLWSRHMDTVKSLQDRLRDHCIQERLEDGLAMLTDLPVECLRQIVHRIPHHTDLLRFGQTNSTLDEITQDPLVWKRMCSYHFNIKGHNENHSDWKDVYQLCYKKFGHKDQYSDMTVICCHCCSIHWKRLGHPCLSDAPPLVKELKPEDLLLL